MRTTSRPRARKGRKEDLPHGSPLKSVQLVVKLTGAGGGDLKRLASEKGLAVEEKGGDLTLTIKASTPEEALAELSVLTGLLAHKGQVP